MTDKEIIKALECCGKGFGNCEGRPYDNENNDCVTNDGKTLIFQDTLDLINRQKAEIEKLTVNMNAYGLGMKRLSEQLETAKTEAIKEFAERLKGKSHVSLNQCGEMKPLIYFDDIDNLVKEMVEGEQI